MARDDGDGAGLLRHLRERGDELARRRRTLETGQAIQTAIEGGDEHGASVVEQARLGGECAFVAARTVGQLEGAQQLEGGKPPELHRAYGRLAVHVGRRGDDAIDPGHDGRRVRADAPVDAGPIRGRRSHERARGRELGEPARRHAQRIVLHLKGREHIAVRQTHEAVRMHHPRDVLELSGEPRMLRVVQVEDEASTGAEAVREQTTVRRHLMLGMVRHVPETRHRQRGDDSSIARRSSARVEHREEVRLRRVGARCPKKEMRAGRETRCGLRGESVNGRAEEKRNAESDESERSQ